MAIAELDLTTHCALCGKRMPFIPALQSRRGDTPWCGDDDPKNNSDVRELMCDCKRKVRDG